MIEILGWINSQVTFLNTPLHLVVDIKLGGLKVSC